MKNITGDYEKHGKLIKFSAAVPSDWSELDKFQFATIIQVLHFRKADPYTISVSLLALLFGAKNFHILDGLPDEYLHSLVPLTNFLMEEKPAVKNFFPEINIRKNKHIAPAEDLSNLGFGEWCFAFESYNYYKLTNDIKGLNTLIAVLYRPIDPADNESSSTFSGDRREKFNENLIEKRTKSVAAIEERIKLAILAWFTVALSDIADARPHVFPKRNEEVAEEAVEPTSDSATWLDVFSDLLGPKWGNIEQLKYTNAMMILNHLEKQQIEFEKISRKK